MTALPILFEDSDMLVVNKPAGVIVNDSDTTTHIKTLQGLVDEYLHIVRPKTKLIEQRKAGEWESPEEAFTNRSGIVHRLDKETSGIILVAKNVLSFTALQKQFKERIVEKTYTALTHGKIMPKIGEINVPVGRLTFNRKRFGIVAGGRESVTEYEVIDCFENPKTKEVLSLVRLHPKTGRTHQIRVHLQYLKHPIFGDELYAGRKQSREDRKVLPRVFLHAQSISFLHPKTGQKMHFEAPLTDELQRVLHSFIKV